jgi:cellulose 1,4-beta-cellobiosidase
MGTFIKDIETQNKGGANPPIAGLFVVYDLPDRDCAALASNGEYSIANNGVANYKAYIDAIRTQLTTYSDVHTILVIGTLQVSRSRRCGRLTSRQNPIAWPTW